MKAVIITTFLLTLNLVTPPPLQTVVQGTEFVLLYFSKWRESLFTIKEKKCEYRAEKANSHWWK